MICKQLAPNLPLRLLIRGKNMQSICIPFAKQPVKRFGRQFVFDDDFARTQRRVKQNGEEKRRVLLRFLADRR